MKFIILSLFNFMFVFFAQTAMLIPRSPCVESLGELHNFWINEFHDNISIIMQHWDGRPDVSFMIYYPADVLPTRLIYPHLLKDVNIKGTIPYNMLIVERAGIEEDLGMIKEFLNFLESSMNKNLNYDELYRLLKKKLDRVAMEADIFIPEELVEVIATKVATRLQQQVVHQRQIEKIERLQQGMEEEGATILRRTKREEGDDKHREARLLLMVLVLWFLLCYCFEGAVWCVDVDLTFGLSVALSDIVLLLGGDIEKNPGPLTGTWACTMMIGSSSIIVLCFLSRRRVGKCGRKVFV